MIRPVILATCIACGLAPVNSARAESLSPVFGVARATPLTVEQNKSVLGKGYYADFYGSYGVSFANYAGAIGAYGDYSTAAAYADYAYQYFSVAAYYQRTGQ